MRCLAVKRKSFFFGLGACSSPALRKNDERIPPEHTCFKIAACSGKGRIPHVVGAIIAAKCWRYALMIIASDNHAYRYLTPFAPVIRGHKCLYGATSLQAPSAPPKMGAVGSPCSPVRAAKAAFSAPTCRGCRLHPCPVRPPPKGVGSPTIGQYRAQSPPLRGLPWRYSPKGQNRHAKPLPRPPPLK